ncbi:MAG: adenylate kinase [Erysipelotrichaceae bacterium]|nr:adenylate kinase [Erysipelotrichaceae bacterium]
MNMLIMGPAGAGKGTMSEKIMEKYGITHISTGDMFREEMRNNTELGQAAKSYIEAGKLVPDEITIGMVNSRISRGDCGKGYLLDGFPRSLVQAEAYDLSVEGTDMAVNAVINLAIDSELLISRIENRRICKDCGAVYNLISSPSMVEGICDRCGGELYQRADDNRERLVVRMQEYENETAPVLDYYREKGLVHDVDASLTIEEVWQQIDEILAALA